MVWGNLGLMSKRKYLNKSDKITKKISDGSSRDRRSGHDRRKCLNPKYFLENGCERRSWKERRKYWYMTM
jgi:hypothetical protein